MRASVGLVVGFKTKQVENHDELFKWHLCVCDKAHQYLFVCGRRYDGDYRLSNQECDRLPYQSSYISMRRVLFYPRIWNDSRFACNLSEDYLRGLYEHIRVSDVMTPIDKAKVLPGLSRRIK